MKTNAEKKQKTVWKLFVSVTITLCKIINGVHS